MSTPQMIQVRDVEGYGGFPSMFQPQSPDDLRKALVAGYQSPRTDGGGALRVESLEQTLRIVTFRGEHIELYKDVPKVPAISTMHEWNLQTSYGTDVGGFTDEGEAGQVVDSAYLRRVMPLKFMSLQREITHPMLLVKHAHGDIVAGQTRDGALKLLQLVERGLFFGRSDAIPAAFDGFDQQLRSDSTYGLGGAQTNIVDLRGGPLTDSALENGINTIVHRFGRATDLYSAPQAMSDFSQEYYAKQRMIMPPPASGVAGGSFTGFLSANGGMVNLKRDIFLRGMGRFDVNRTAPTAATSTKAPAAPASIVGTPGATTGSLFLAADVGTFQYKATAINKYGESAPVQESGGVIISAAGDGVSLVITDTAGTYASTGYRIWRSLVGGLAGTEQLIAEVPRVGSAATTTYVDINRYLPGCSRAYLFQMNQNAVSIAQLAPMMKLPLATVGPTLRWLHLMYLAAILYTPQWLYVFDNVRDA